jgi:hypothetical protein
MRFVLNIKYVTSYQLFVAGITRFSDHKHLGSGNITVLTGLFPTVLPDIQEKIASAFLNVYQELEWGSYYQGTISLVSCFSRRFLPC